MEQQTVVAPMMIAVMTHGMGMRVLTLLQKNNDVLRSSCSVMRGFGYSTTEQFYGCTLVIHFCTRKKKTNQRIKLDDCFLNKTSATPKSTMKKITVAGSCNMF